MRLIRITTNYPQYIERFCCSHPELKEQSYAVQYRALMDDCYGWADFWTIAFGKLGYEVWEPVGNAESQQKAWAREHGARFEDSNWLLDIVAAQVKHFRPDVLFVNDHHTFSKSYLEHLRSECPSIRLVMGWCGAPYSDASVFDAYDVVLSNIRSFVDYFRGSGHRCELMQHAFEPRILDKIHIPAQLPVAFSFAGSVFKAKNFHTERENLLQYLVRHTDLQIWSDVQAPPIAEYRRLASRQRKRAIMRRIQELPGGHRLLKLLPQAMQLLSDHGQVDLSKLVSLEIVEKANPGLYGLAMYQLICNSRVTFNNHIDCSARFANNMRLYESTGMGACLLTDWKENIAEIFEPDVEVVTYRGAREAAEKVRYLLTHEESRRQIAQSGQRRTLRAHTFDIRAAQLDDMMKRLL